MRKLLAFLLVIATMIPMLGGIQMHVSAANNASTMNTADITPFTVVNWTSPDEAMDNVVGLPLFIVDGKTIAQNKDDWKMVWSARGDLQQEAQSLKAYMDKVPDGARYIYVATYSTFVVMTEDVIYHDEGVARLKTWVTEFLSYYKSIGGKLDGIILDTEYPLDSISNIAKGHFNEIVASSKYDIPDKYDNVDGAGMLVRIQKNAKYPKLRQMLEKEGFVFYSGTDKSELSYMLDSKSSVYSIDRSIWSKVMALLERDYLHEAIFEPLISFYEDAVLSDWDYTNTQSWLKTTGTNGYSENVTGNRIEVGNASNLYTYAQRPGKSFYAGDGAKYPPGYNKAVYEDTAFGAFRLDIRAFKDMQAATDEDGNLNAWITFYDYNYGTNTASYAKNTVSGTAYHTETLYHIGLMNPKPFLGYVYKNDIKTDEAQRRVVAAGKELTTENVNAEKAELTSDIIAEMYRDRLQNLSDIMAELNRVAGASDRKPIPYAGSWNSDFVISGMYAGGRNIWRITPDITQCGSLEQFKVDGQTPTFRLNGQTVTFPQGKILEETKIAPYGSCGYWVETPVGVEPTVVNDVDRHSKYPAYEETFSAELNKNHWTKTGGKITVQDGVLTMSGGATLKNKSIPSRITAGDNYAKQQAWEVTFSVNATDIKAILLSCSASNDIRIENGNLEYGGNGKFTTLASISANTTYTLRREVDLVKKKSSYYLYDADGKELAKVTDVAMGSITTPVSDISFWVTSDSADHKLMLDNYKLYPIGITTDFERYDAATGYKLTKTTNEGATAYRLSWMNASAQAQKATVIAEFYDGDTLVSTKTVREFVMDPGADGVETEIVPLSDGKAMTLSITVTDSTAPDNENQGDKTIDATTDNAGATQDTPAPGEKKGLSGGVIALIAVGAAVAVASGVLFLIKKEDTIPWIAEIIKRIFKK